MRRKSGNRSDSRLWQCILVAALVCGSIYLTSVYKDIQASQGKEDRELLSTVAKSSQEQGQGSKAAVSSAGPAQGLANAERKPPVEWVLANDGSTKKLSDYFTNTLDEEDRTILEGLFTVPIYDKKAVWPGFTMFAFSFNNYWLMYDMEGKIVASRRTGTKSEHIVYHGVKFVNSTTILALRVTLAALNDHNKVKHTHFMLWNLATGQELLVKDPIPPNRYATFHHDIDYNPITRTFLGLYKYLHRNASGSDDKAVYDEFFEVTEDGKVIWEWDAKVMFPFTPEERNHWRYTGDCAQVWQLQKKDCIDWMHGNTLYWDFEHDVIYYNSRSLDAFYKIEKKSGKRVWGVGRRGDMPMKDINGKEVPALFYHAHSVDKQNDTTFMLFDNNYNNRHVNPGGPRLANLQFRSILTEVTISPDFKSARVSWQWEAPRNYSSIYNGDADMLPNSNVLGTFPQGITMTEVNREGRIMWELRGPPDKVTPYKWPIYRSERVYDRPPLLHPKVLHISSQDTKVALELKVWNTHKSRIHTPAVLTLTQSGSKFSMSREFEIKPYWQATEISIAIPLKKLSATSCQDVKDSIFMVSIMNSDGVDVLAGIPLSCV